jgi:hypothetical protein
MDGQRFDNLARLFGSGTSRRRLLKLLGGGLAATVMTRPARALAGSCGAAGDSCGADLPQCCGGLECNVTETCQPFQPQCGFEGSACVGDGDCCSGKCCDGTCHENYACCPTDFTSPSPDCGFSETCDNNGLCTPLPCAVHGSACTADGDCCEGICCGNSCRSGAACCWEDGASTTHCSIGEFCSGDGVCVPEPICGVEGTGCAFDGDCCQGKCCDGTCRMSYACCPIEATLQSPDCGFSETCDSNGACAPIACVGEGASCANAGCCEGLTCVADVCEAAGSAGCESDDDCAATAGEAVAAICCGGACVQLECCIDADDPNERCGAGETCFEGICDPVCTVEEDACSSSSECCKDLSCIDGVCAFTEDDDDPEDVTSLPSTGSGEETVGPAGTLVTGLIAGAAALVAAKVRSSSPSSKDTKPRN